MAATLEDIKQFLERKNLRYFVHPERPVLMLGMQGVFGTYQFLALLEREGEFFQFRTSNYLHCPADHPNLKEVLKVLASINHKMRLVKFAWNPSSGEIAVYADIWLMDGILTRKQFDRMIDTYLPVADVSFERIKKTMEIGRDPGEKKPEDIVTDMLADGKRGLPPRIRDLLSLLKGKKKKQDASEVTEL